MMPASRSTRQWCEHVDFGIGFDLVAIEGDWPDAARVNRFVTGTAGEQPIRDARDALKRAVLGLPEKYRTVLLMKHYRNLKYREMAQELGLNEGTVKSRLNTAAQLLRERLRREGWLP